MSDHESTWTHFASSLLVGDSKYVQTTLKASERLEKEIRKELASSYTVEEFRVGLFTCVSADNVGDVRYLVCVERIA